MLTQKSMTANAMALSW